MNSSVDFRAAEEDVEAQRQELMAGFDQIPYARENTSLERKLTTWVIAYSLVN